MVGQDRSSPSAPVAEKAKTELRIRVQLKKTDVVQWGYIHLHFCCGY